MERTESRIIQVAPAHENGMIEEMQRFAWNLLGRQEMRIEGHTSPDISVSAFVADSIGGTQSYKTKIKHYVKLHFARSLDIPNLERLRQIESEYFNLPFPSSAPPPRGKDPPAGLFGLLALGFLVMGILIEPVFLLGAGVMVVAALCIGIPYDKKVKKHVENVTRIREQSERRAQELMAELESLGYG